MAIFFQEDLITDEFKEIDFFDGTECVKSEEIDQTHLDHFLWNSVVYASVCVEEFFKDKEMYGGGPVPDRMLHSSRYLSIVLNYNSDKLEYMYDAMKRSGHELTVKKVNSAMIPGDVKLVISILRECFCLGIPKEFVFGIVLMYLEICEGVEIIDC
jgi:hypothetical protein